MLTPDERQTLLDLARASVAARVSGLPPPVATLIGRLAEPRGAFVTLRKGQALRGCIGCVESSLPLADVVVRCAASAATDDPRFPPMTVEELVEIDVEISVLGLMEPASEPGDIHVGRHGVIVEHRGLRGLLLPQVAIEWGWDAETFLAQTCVKAGLRPEAWRRGATIFRFEAEVFGAVAQAATEAS